MNKLLGLLLLIPLAAMSAGHAGKPAEHGGKAMQTKEQATKAAEHEKEKLEKKEHAGEAVTEKKEQAGKPVN